MDRELVGEVFALGDPDRVDLADQVGDGGVRGSELLAVALVRGDPAHGDPVAIGRDAVTASPADGRVGTVIDLAAVDDGHLRIEQVDQRADQAALGLPALAEEDDVLARQDRVLDLGNDG